MTTPDNPQAQPLFNLLSISHKNVQDNLYLPIMTEVKKARDDVEKYEEENEDNLKTTNDNIVNIMKHEIFNYANWEIRALPQNICENYRSNISQNLFEKFFSNGVSRNEIYNDIISSYMQGGTIPSLHNDIIKNGILDNYNEIKRINEDIFERNEANIEKFYDIIMTRTEKYIYNDNIITRISEINASNKIEVSKNTDEISQIDQRISNLNKIKDRTLKAIITPNDPPNEDLDDDDPDGGKAKTSAAEVFRTVILGILTPFAAIYGFFEKLLRVLFAFPKAFFINLGERMKEFSGFVSSISAMPAFWFSIIFAFANGYFFYRIFSEMFTDISIALMFIFIYSVIFAILPFFASKHLFEIVYNERKKAIEVIILVVFEFLIFALAISYPFMAYQVRDILGDSSQTQQIAALTIGIIPFISSIITGFTHYRYLQKTQNN